MLLVFSARVILNYCVAPDTFLSYCLNTTLMVIVAIVHYDVCSV